MEVPVVEQEEERVERGHDDETSEAKEWANEDAEAEKGDQHVVPMPVTAANL
jgi:hypothetical protein